MAKRKSTGPTPPEVERPCPRVRAAERTPTAADRDALVTAIAMVLAHTCGVPAAGRPTPPELPAE